MSSEGLPVDGIIGVDVTLDARSTQQATTEAKSSLSADSAANSADAAFKFSREAKAESAGATDAATRAETAAGNAQTLRTQIRITLPQPIQMERLRVLLARRVVRVSEFLKVSEMDSNITVNRRSNGVYVICRTGT